MNMIGRKHPQKGFTLIEIAIVLVIIGLILGGILQGQQLITSARVRALADQMEDITVAWFAFQDRYRAYPGDFPNTGGLISVGGVAVAGGDGNGQVDTDAESGLVWQQLSGAGLLAGAYDGAAVTGFGCAGTTCPLNPFNRGILVRFSNQSIGPAGTGLASSANELWTGNQIPVNILAEMDRKLDDGNANSGRLQLSQDGAGWTGSAACLNASNNYNVAGDSSDCAAIFRNF